MKKILFLFCLLPILAHPQSQIDQFQIFQLGYNASPGNPPSFTGYVYINNFGQLVCTLHNGSSCLSGGGGSGTIIASPSPDCLPYYQGANTTLTADCALVTDTAGGLTLVKLTVSGVTTGVITLKTGSAPANPASGNGSLYIDSITQNLTCINSSGGTCMPAGVTSVFGRSGVVAATLGDYDLSLINGGIAPGSQTYDFQTNTDVVDVVTQTTGDSSIKAASTAFVGNAVTASQQAQVIAAHNYGVKADTRWVWDATITNGSNAFSCPNSDCNFTSADNGKICFATNASPGGAGSLLTGVVILPQGTFTFVSAQSGTCSGGNATATATALGLLVWGSDDSTALTNAWNAAVAACGTLQLPGVNPSLTGPGAMLVQSAQFNSTNSTTGCFYANGTTATSANRQGIGVAGVDVNSTFIIPTPLFDFTTCPTITSIKTCFLGVSDGINIRDLSIWGAGNSKPASSSAQLSTSIVTVLPKNNSQVHHLSIMGWGAQTGATGIGFGLTFGGNDFIGDYINVDGAGQTGCHEYPQGGNNVNVVSTYALQCGDNSTAALWVDGNGAVVPTTYTSIAGVYFNGTSGTSGNCIVTVSRSANFYSIGDAVGLGINSPSNGICIGYPNVSAGKAYFTGLNLNVSLAVNGNGIYLNASGNIATISNSTFAVTPGAGGAVFKSGATGANFFDLGGITTTGSSGTFFSASGSGAMFGSNSITGTVPVAGNLVLTSGWGTANVNTIVANSDSLHSQFTISITGGVPAAGPVLTYTFPTAFFRTPTCTITEVSGTFGTLSNPAHVVTTTTDTITFTGTPVNGQSYTFVETCQ